jgi:phage-related protein
MTSVKPIEFAGDSLARLRDFTPTARRAAGYQLDRVQRGLEPDDWKPMTAVGQGVRELRIRDRAGAFRVIYLAALSDRIVVLHAFQKKAQRTARHDIELAARRLRQWRKD